jgi:hypothetical protein
VNRSKSARLKLAALDTTRATERAEAKGEGIHTSLGESICRNIDLLTLDEVWGQRWLGWPGWPDGNGNIHL